MDQAAIDRVLACRTLPSLPGVALEVLDLTRDPRVQIEKIAKVVQNDPALTTKILRTVNSSFYGLTNPCPTISRAVSLLGLNTVKSLVLGFSLVDMTGRGERRGFDIEAYWRRTIYAAAGARLLARRVRSCDPEEAFIGGLLQDVGMLATHAALGDRYGAVLEAASEDHDELAALEHEMLGFDHAEVGSLLAEKWKLTAQIVECTRHHHRPESAAPSFLTVLRLVALGSDAAATLTLSNPRSRLSQFVSRAEQWFSVRRDEAEQILSDIAEGASQLSSLLEIKTGTTPDVSQILAEASDQLTSHQISVEQEANQLQRSNQELARQVITDALTGAANRKHFDAEIERVFAAAESGGPPVSVLFSDADRFKSVNDVHGHQAGDAVLVELSRRMKETIGSTGTVCRYGGEEFAIIVPGCGLEQASSTAELIRKSVEAKPIDLRPLALPVKELAITISVGVASSDLFRFESAAQLVHAADEAVYAAKEAGRNCIRVAKRPGWTEAPATGQSPPAARFPESSIATPSGIAPVERTTPQRSSVGNVSILIVEHDPLAAKLLELTLARRSDLRVRVATSAEDALHTLSASLGATEPRPDLLLCALDLPGIQGIDLIRTLRVDRAWRTLPIVAMAAANELHAAAACQAAGADLSITKAQFCSNLARWTSQIVELATNRRKAA